ncbi:MAG: Hsp20/alpha crystallin family protein [Candidatus Dormibacteraeota bacterium]|nr:Hsp20/alpha crystallin family protein [Candidatus Dormibacteraeota bacterium]
MSETRAETTQDGAEVPPANVYEGNGQLSVATPIPGAHPDHTEVVVRPDRVLVEAHCKYPQESQHYHLRGWRVGSWRLAVPLPKRVDPSRARATLNLGVLVVMAPTAERVGAAESHPRVE